VAISHQEWIEDIHNYQRIR